tara:strand:- start:1034 stop:1588 length:555 start_codon:yes stop_codon:yes gene_type:complete
MPPRSLNRREYGEFKRMLEQALLEVRLPAGIVDTDNIIPGSIRPQNCKMDATWNFRGNVSAGGKSLNNPSIVDTDEEEETENAANIVNQVVEVNERATVGTADIYFLNALKQTVTLTLPVASKNIGRKIYVKRVDKDQANICRVLTAEAGKLDGTDGIELNVQESVILIASSTQWHVFSLDFKL